MVPRRVLPLLALVLAVALAGCAQQAPGGIEAPGDPADLEGTPVEEEAARVAMVEAFSNAKPGPEARRMETLVTLLQGGETWATLLAQEDRDTEEALFRMTGLENLMDADEQEGPNGFRFDPPGGDAFWIYSVGKATVFHAGPNATAIYDPDGARDEGRSFFDEGERDGDSNVDPTEGFFEHFRDYRDFGVEEAEAVTYKGEPAMKIAFTHEAEEGTVRGLVVVYLGPAQPAYLKAEVPPEPDGEDSPDEVLMEFAYGDDVTLATTPALARAAVLATRSENAFFGGPETTETTRFWDAGRVDVAVDEIHLVVKASEPDSAPSGFGGQDEDAEESRPPAGYTFVMPLSAGAKEDDRIRASFDDADGDGKVTSGDAYTLSVVDEENDSLGNYVAGLLDVVTETFVTPGAGLFAMVAGLAGAGGALSRRRR